MIWPWLVQLYYLSIDAVLYAVQSSCGRRLHDLHGCGSEACFLLLLQQYVELVEQMCGRPLPALHHRFGHGQVKGHAQQLQGGLNAGEVIQPRIRRAVITIEYITNVFI